jgi:hypothetical protein
VSRLGRRGPAGTGTTTLLNVCECHPCYLLEAPGGAKRSSASSSRCRTNSRRISSSRAWLATRQSGWLAALASSAWASVCSSRPIRFGFILAPRHPVPVCPRSSSGIRRRAARRALPVVQGLRLRRFVPGCALPSWQAPRRARNGCLEHRFRVALGPLHTPRPRAFTRGRAERHRSGACPRRPVIPGPTHIPFGRAGPRLMPWTWSRQTPPRTGPQKYPALAAAPLVTTGRSPREVPSICRATVGDEAARWQAATALRPRWTAVRR